MKKTLCLVLATLFLSSCATVFKGNEQTVTFMTEPSNAEVIIDGHSFGRTPLTVKLKKNKYETVMFKLDGYKPYTRPIEKSYDAVALLNVFWDSSTTDLVSGAAYEYSPNTYFMKLDPEAKVSAAK